MTMTPKGEVNQNVIVNSDDISDISKDTVDDKGISSCLKSLRKTRLCRFLISISPPLNTVINRRTISLMLKCLSWASWFCRDDWKQIFQGPESPSTSSSRAYLARVKRWPQRLLRRRWGTYWWGRSWSRWTWYWSTWSWCSSRWERHW